MRQIAIAEHLLTQSYPALADPKILISALQNAYSAVDEAITHVLREAREKKEIPAYSTTFTGKLTAYKLYLAKKGTVTAIDFMLVTELQELLLAYQESSTAFRRKDAFVIADDAFHIKTLTPEKTNTYIQRIKSLLTRL